MPNEPIGNQPPRKFTLSGFLVVIVIIILVLAITFPAVHYARENARRTECQVNLRWLGLATHHYLDAYRCFPPAYAVDDAGRVMYSWRMSLCPFINHSPMAVLLDFDRHWDDPANHRVLARGYYLYECPVDQTRAVAATNYTMIVGPGTLSDGRSAARPDKITDGLSNTIMYVETTGAKIPWAAPGDLEADKISFGANKPPMPGIASAHPGGANCVFCDASVGFLTNSIEPSQVRAMCTISGGEKTESDVPPRFKIWIDGGYGNGLDCW